MIVPVLEDKDILEEENIEIIDVDTEVKLDEILIEKETLKPND